MIIAATGHRPDKLGGYNRATGDRLLLGARIYLEEAKPDAVISGMAQGWDTAWALAALELGIPLIAAIPHDAQFAIWPIEAQQRWSDIVARCSQVVHVTRGDFAGWKMMHRNKWMVDNSDRLCALWNGDISGGTFNCVQYARKKKKPIDNLWDDFKAVRS